MVLMKDVKRELLLLLCKEKREAYSVERQVGYVLGWEVEKECEYKWVYSRYMWEGKVVL